MIEMHLANLDGQRALVGMPTLPEAAPPAVREALVRRRIVLAGGQCPCGAVLQLPNRAQRRAAKRRGEPLVVNVLHEHDCPAGSAEAEMWARRAWSG